MNNTDIRFNILYHLHINDLSNLCYVDHLSYKICTDPHFWKLYFEKHDLPFDMINIPKSINEWISVFIGEYRWDPQDFNDMNDVD